MTYLASFARLILARSKMHGPRDTLLAHVPQTGRTPSHFLLRMRQSSHAISDFRSLGFRLLPLGEESGAGGEGGMAGDQPFRGLVGGVKTFTQEEIQQHRIEVGVGAASIYLCVLLPPYTSGPRKPLRGTMVCGTRELRGFVDPCASLPESAQVPGTTTLA